MLLQVNKKNNWHRITPMPQNNKSTMSKEYYKKKIIDLRASLQREKEAKKRDNEYYARMIKSTSSSIYKTNYRKYKIDKAASHDRQIEYLKRQIESTKESLKRCK